MKTTFNFISLMQLDKLIEENNLRIVTFYGASWHYVLFNGIYYIFNEGYHCATKNGNKISYNPNASKYFDSFKGVKKAIKNIYEGVNGIIITV